MPAHAVKPGGMSASVRIFRCGVSRKMACGPPWAIRRRLGGNWARGPVAFSDNNVGFAEPFDTRRPCTGLQRNRRRRHLSGGNGDPTPTFALSTDRVRFLRNAAVGKAPIPNWTDVGAWRAGGPALRKISRARAPSVDHHQHRNRKSPFSS